ncbi:MAG: abortive infection system antitoxin AbiGi family protein [Planctomycetota bacterium]
MFKPDAVCFCDIPVDDLKIHTQKYGYFGLSFRKEFIASKGGAPVFYMPKQRAEEFDRISSEVVDLFKDSINKTSSEEEKQKHIKRFLFMLKNIFSYLKSFDHMLTEDHMENFYFEREWRVLGDLKFELKDVRRVFLPEFYAKRFHKKLPDYCGQVTFTIEGVQDGPTMKEEIICGRCQHREEVRIPENTTVSLGQVFDERGNNCGNLICVKCGSTDVAPVLQDDI